ncbi:hypothetical protein LTR08_000051 [Meristemomyces frigidus]|nr:hypothetical protein LTR08_000051 [Meristemomyces frigidus]
MRSKLRDEIVLDSKVEILNYHALFFHLAQEHCQKMQPLSLGLADDASSAALAGRNLYVHVQHGRSAYSRRVEDLRATKTAWVNVKLRVRSHIDNLVDAGSITFQLPASVRVTELPMAVKQRLIKFLHDEGCGDKLIFEAVQSTGNRIWYHTGFRSTTTLGAEYISADDFDETLNIDNLSDLFRDPQAENNALGMLATFVMEYDEEVLEDFMDCIGPRFNSTSRKFYRLGMKSRVLGGTPSVNDKTAIKVRGVLIACCNHDYSPRLELRTIPAFDFDDFCIGNCGSEDADEYEEYSSTDNARFKLQPPFHSFVNRFYDFEVEIKDIATSAHPALIVGNGLPIMPPYTFNDFSPATAGMITPALTDFPRTKQIRLAVGFAHNLAYEGGITFAPDITFDVPPDSDARTIRLRIIAELRKCVKGSGRDNTYVLFEEQLRGVWETELFAMPQEPGEMKLYRYASPDDNVGLFPLRALLDRHSVQRGDCRVYMLAYLMDKDAMWRVTGALYDPKKYE